MKKGWFLVGIIFLLVPWLVVGCGISEEVYNAVVAERNAAQAQVQSLQGDLTKVQGDLTEAQAQIKSLQGDLTTVESDLTEAKVQIQSLQSDKEVAEENNRKALAYAEFLDIVMYPVWMEEGVTPRFKFEDDIEWFVDMKNRASNMEDGKLMNLVKEMERGNEFAVTEIFDHCLGKIPEPLK